MTGVLILVGMSVREVDARDQLHAWARAAGGSLAFLQEGDPSVSRELDRLADQGAAEVVLVGVSLGSLAPGVSWLRRVASYWWRERAGHRPRLLVGPRLVGASEEISAQVAAARVVTGSEAPMVSPAWEQVTAHRHQVLVCRGPRCTALGSDASAEALVLALMAEDYGDDDVLVTHTGCQLPCNHAPVVSVQPDDVWYAGVTPDVARRVVAEHLVAGQPLADHRLPRLPRTP